MIWGISSAWIPMRNYYQIRLRHSYLDARVERNQGLVLSLAGALAFYQTGTSDPVEAFPIARSVRWDWVSEAQECLNALDKPANVMSPVEAEVRTHDHDFTHAHHDRHPRCLISFPPPKLDDFTVLVLKVALDRTFIIHSSQTSVSPPDPEKTLVVLMHRIHMRAVVPPSRDWCGRALRVAAVTSVRIGWKHVLDAPISAGLEIERTALDKCASCNTSHIRIPKGMEGEIIGKGLLSWDGSGAFYVAGPWTLQAAESFGDSAVGQFWSEVSNQPRHEKTQAPEDAFRAADALVVAIREEPKYSSAALAGLVDKCTTLDKACGHFELSARVFHWSWLSQLKITLRLKG